MMKSALRNRAPGLAIRFESNCNIEPSTGHLAPPARDYSSVHISWGAYCTFMRMTREKADRAVGCRGVA
jgi:hypothetical protein